VSRIKDIKTISRTSVMGYRGTTKNLRQIAAELGVGTILEGGVQRSGDQVRINVQLVDARTDTHLWAQTYDKQLTAENVFAIQSEIASAIVSALRAVLTPEEKRQLAEPPTLNLAALEAFFKAKANDGSSAKTAAAISHLQQSLDLDPAFAEAHAAIATQYLRQVWTDGLPVAEQVAKAKPHVDRALALAPRSSSAFVALGVLRHRQNDVEGSVTALRQAIAFNANNAEAFGLLGYVQLWAQRDSRAAVESYRHALELDPLSPLLRQQLIEALLVAGPFDEALAEANRLLAEAPDNVEGLRNYGELQEFVAYRYDEAIKAYRRTVALDPRNPNFARKLASTYFALGDNAAARFWFERALLVAPHSREAAFLNGMLKLIAGDQAAALELFRAVPEGTAGHGLARYFRLRAALETDPAAALAGLAPMEPAAVVTQSNLKVQCVLAYLLLAAGKGESGESLASRILAVLPEMPRIGLRGYFDGDVLVHLGRGDRKRALGALRELSNTGACSVDFAAGTPFRILREDPEFQALLTLNAKRLTEQRATLERWEATGALAPIAPLPDNPR
jgi:tetratricopeptide (TPR) repeat protein